jgi:cytochrome c-type biogenesis protein
MFEISGIGVVTAVFAGAVSFLSPCVLPLVPAYLSYIAGKDLEDLRVRPRMRVQSLVMGVPFVLGFSTVFILFGLGATAVGQLLLAYRNEAGVVGGIVVTVFGLFMLDILKIPALRRELRLPLPIREGRPLAAYVLGVAFAFGWTPCIGPVLGAILTVGATAATGGAAALLALYSLGLAIPFLLAAAFTGFLVRRRVAVGRIGRALHNLTGIILIVFGLLMITGQLERLAIWLLATFPILGQLG